MKKQRKYNPTEVKTTTEKIKDYKSFLLREINSLKVAVTPTEKVERKEELIELYKEIKPTRFFIKEMERKTNKINLWLSREHKKLKNYLFKPKDFLFHFSMAKMTNNITIRTLRNNTMQEYKTMQRLRELNISLPELEKLNNVVLKVIEDNKGVSKAYENIEKHNILLSKSLLKKYLLVNRNLVRFETLISRYAKGKK